MSKATEVKIMVELKTDKDYNSTHEAQLINYLHAPKLRAGLLIHCGASKCTPTCMVT